MVGTKRLNTLELAFQWAKSDRFTTLDELIRSLDRDGYHGKQVSGPLLQQQLEL